MTGDDKDKKEETVESKPEYVQAFKMFKEGRPLEDVAVDLDIESLTVLSYYQDLLKLTNMRKLVSVYNEIKDDILTI